VVPWAALEALIAPHYPRSGQPGRQPYPPLMLLRIHLMQQWYGYSDPAMEEALYETPVLRRFAGVSLARVPDETTLLHFRHLLERHGLSVRVLAAVNEHLASHGLLMRCGTIMDATLIHAPTSTKNATGTRDPEMHSVKKGNQWYFGMKAHIGVDADSGLVHTVVATSAEVADVTQAEALLHGEEEAAHGDAGFAGADRRVQRQGLTWHIAERRGRIKALPEGPLKAATRYLERLKAKLRARVEHPFRVLKCQFGYRKTRYRGLAKNAAQLHVLFALSNLWQARRRLLAIAGEVRP